MSCVRRKLGRVLNAPRLLRIEIVLIAVLPARLVIGPLKGVGSPATIFGLFMFLAWVFTVLAPGIELARSSVPVRTVLALCWIALLLSYVGANMHPQPSADLANADRTLLQFLAFTGIILMAAEGLIGTEDVLEVVRAAVLGAAFMAFVAILQFKPGLDLTTYIAKIPFLTANGALDSVQVRGGFNRPSGTALHPIEFGVIVGTVLAFAIHLAVYDRASTRWRRILPASLIAAGLSVSLSRSALLTAAVVLVYFFAGTTNRLRWQGALILVGILIVLFIGVPGMIGTLRGLLTAGRSDSSISSRTSDYSAVSGYIFASPWVGRGIGTFLPSYRILDNQYLLSLVETGVLGTVALSAVLFLPAALGRMSKHRSTTDADRNMGQMIAATGMAVMAAAATYDTVSFPTGFLFVAFWVGIAGAWWGITSETCGVAVRGPNVPDERVGGSPVRAGRSLVAPFAD